MPKNLKFTELDIDDPLPVRALIPTQPVKSKKLELDRLATTNRSTAKTARLKATTPVINFWVEVG